MKISIPSELADFFKQNSHQPIEEVFQKKIRDLPPFTRILYQEIEYVKLTDNLIRDDNENSRIVRNDIVVLPTGQNFHWLNQLSGVGK